MRGNVRLKAVPSSISVLFVLSLLLSLPSAELPADSLSADSASRRALADAVERYVGPLDPDWDGSGWRVEWAHLNGDRRLDALVYLDGPAWCGSGGCTVLVMEAVPEEDADELGRFVPAAEISLMHGPVTIAPTASHGWHDLVVEDGQGQWRRLRFDGETYPFSPGDGDTLEAAPVGGTVLFDDREQ